MKLLPRALATLLPCPNPALPSNPTSSLLPQGLMEQAKGREVGLLEPGRALDLCVPLCGPAPAATAHH